MGAALKTVGVNFHFATTAGQTQDWVNALDTAVAQHAGAIMLASVDPNRVEPQLAAAKAANVPVIEAFPVPGQPKNQNITALVPIQFPVWGTAEAAEAIIDTGGNATAMLLYSKDIPTQPGMVTAVNQEFSSSCPKCKMVVEQAIPLSQWASQVPVVARSILTSNPGINTVMLEADQMVQFVAPVLRELGLTGKVKLETSTAIQAGIQDIADGVVNSDAGYYAPWMGWAMADQALRVLTGMPTLTTENVPTALFDSSNIKQTLGSNGQVNLAQFWGDPYVAGYEKLWGVG
jgi:ABC-type sugar transport system substrate-binding protein